MAASLCTAAARGNAAELERRLAATPTADLADYDGRRPLHLAAANGEVACCQVGAARCGFPRARLPAQWVAS